MNKEVSELRGAFFEIVAHMGIIPLSEQIITRAEQPFPVAVKTLDSLHLTSCMLFKEYSTSNDIIFATHDIQQGMAAHALGLTVEGV